MEAYSTADGSAEITFLYRLTRGLAEASFGVWCARYALVTTKDGRNLADLL